MTSTDIRPALGSRSDAQDELAAHLTRHQRAHGVGCLVEREGAMDRLIVYLRGTLAASQIESVPLGREFAQLRAYLEIMSLPMGPRLECPTAPIRSAGMRSPHSGSPAAHRGPG